MSNSRKNDNTPPHPRSPLESSVRDFGDVNPCCAQFCFFVFSTLSQHSKEKGWVHAGAGGELGKLHSVIVA